MTMHNVMSEADIMITATDFDRLKNLREPPPYRFNHAVLLRNLKDGLDRGEIVAADEIPRDVVTMHSKVRVRDLKNDEVNTYTLVYPEEADINAGKLSVLAPLGTALLGTRVRQAIKFDAPSGLRRLKVEKILYQPEAAGDFHL